VKALRTSSGKLWMLRCCGWACSLLRHAGYGAAAAALFQCDRHDGAKGRASGKPWVPAYPPCPCARPTLSARHFAGLGEHLSAA
jgi:hypothetical protein